MGVTLVALAQTGPARAATAVYAVSVMALYGVSGTYHRLPWSPRARQRMRRLDHSMIFVLIAGTYTPLSLLALRGAWRVSVLSAVWGAALLGTLLKMLRFDRMHRSMGILLYLALGWTALVVLPQALPHLGAASTVLLFTGGIFYTMGAVFFGLRWPDPDPRVFGYHEVWHSMVIGGSVCHYAMILLLALAAH